MNNMTRAKKRPTRTLGKEGAFVFITTGLCGSRIRTEDKIP
jgi:hypothetical protein